MGVMKPNLVMRNIVPYVPPHRTAVRHTVRRTVRRAAPSTTLAARHRSLVPCLCHRIPRHLAPTAYYPTRRPPLTSIHTHATSIHTPRHTSWPLASGTHSVIMAGVIGIYGLIVGVILQGSCKYQYVPHTQRRQRRTSASAPTAAPREAREHNKSFQVHPVLRTPGTTYPGHYVPRTMYPAYKPITPHHAISLTQ